jgi:hypothetical protein
MYRRGGKAAAPIHPQNELKQKLQSGLGFLLSSEHLSLREAQQACTEVVEVKQSQNL